MHANDVHALGLPYPYVSRIEHGGSRTRLRKNIIGAGETIVSPIGHTKRWTPDEYALVSTFGKQPVRK